MRFMREHKVDVKSALKISVFPLLTEKICMYIQYSNSTLISNGFDLSYKIYTLSDLGL